jgi:hypothetical protein
VADRRTTLEGNNAGMPVATRGNTRLSRPGLSAGCGKLRNNIGMRGSAGGSGCRGKEEPRIRCARARSRAPGRGAAR